MLFYILVLLVGGSAAAGFGVMALMRRRGVPPRAALISGLAAGAAGGLALFLYGFEAFAYALNDTGPDIHDFSPYVEYHELGGWPEAALIAAYVLIPLVLVAAGVLAGAYKARPFGVVLCVLGGLAVLLPLIVPGRLDAFEVGSTPVLHTFRSGEVRGPYVRTCMEYGVPRDGNPNLGGLCLDLARTPRSEELLDQTDSDELQIQDVTFALNDKGVTPREDPGDLPEIGLEIERHQWYPGEPPLP